MDLMRALERRLNVFGILNPGCLVQVLCLLFPLSLHRSRRIAK